MKSRRSFARAVRWPFSPDGARAMAAFATLLVPACAGRTPSSDVAWPSAPGAIEGAPFERRITPFPVLGPDRGPYTHPFLGGLDVPRPQFVDIDGDGDLDLFVQERTDEVMFFENAGTPSQPRFVWRTDHYHDLVVGEWNRFTDLDADGDLDLLAEQKFSYIRYFRNDGTRTSARFVPAADSVKDSSGEPVFSDRQNIPSIADIDCDSMPDLFLGRIDGTVTRYEQTGFGTVPVFDFVIDRFEEIEIVATFGSARHGANSMAFADSDGDGDLDLHWGDFFEAGVLFIENAGSCPVPYLRTQPVPMPGADSLATSGYNAPYLADIDADGDLDLFIGVLGGAFNPTHTASDNFWFYEHLGPQEWQLRTRRFLDGIDVGNESIPAFADIDADGDVDMLLANKIAPTDLQTAGLHVFENVGSPTAPQLALVDTVSLAEAYHYAPALGDLDGDGDLDLLLGTWNDDVQLYWNQGSRTAFRFVQDTAATIRLPRGSNSAPALADLDGDGDLDVVIGESVGSLNFYRNNGTRESPRFELETEDWQGIDIGRRAYPVFVDLDRDGDLDLVVGKEDAGVRTFRNVGTRQSPRFEADDALFALPLPPLATPAFIDLDGDGDLDVVSGTSAGGLVYWENVAAGG